MKKIFTLILLVIAYTVSAHPNDGKLTITNLSSQRIVVEVDGKKFNNRMYESDNQILVPALSTGFHTIKVYTLPVGRDDARYGIRKQTLIFQRNVNVRPQYHIDIVVNRFAKVWLDELSMKDRNYVDMDNNDQDNDHNDQDTPRDNDDKYGRPMSVQSFTALKEALSKERFDNARVTIAKQVIDQNYFTADQVKQLVQMYSTDSYKLDLAKYAYKNTVNKQEYFILYEAFTFSSSKEDLANYIRQFK